MNLLEAARLALHELDLIDTQEFDPSRFIERIHAIEALVQAIRDTEREEAELEANTIAQYETTEFPEWMAEASQLFMDNLSSLSRDEEARLLPDTSVVFFL